MTTRQHPGPSRGKPRLTGELIGSLTEEIVAGRMEPETRLPTERELMHSFGVSRTVVREAIAALRAEGLVETRRGAGAFVASDPRRRPFRIDPDALLSRQRSLDVMELRICVEVEAVGLAAARRTPADIAELKRLCQEFAVAAEAGEDAIDIDFAIHSAIGAATGNPYFSSFLEFLGRMIIPQRGLYRDRDDDDELAAYMRILRKDHDMIAAAIIAGDVAGARRTMRKHLRRGRDRVLAGSKNTGKQGE